MAVSPTQTDFNMLSLPVRSNKIKIEVLNFSFQVISSFEGQCTEGSISIDANSDIRRTCNLTLQLKGNKDIVQSGDLIWVDRYVKIYAGTYNPKTDETVWTNMGIFLINNPDGVYNSTTNQITFEGLDLMARLTERRGGQLLAVTTVVPAESVLNDVVKSIIEEMTDFDKYIIEDNDYTIPYDIKMDMGSTVYDLLATIRDLYSDWEMFFDTDGVFHWQQIPTGESSPVILDMNEYKDRLIIQDGVNLDFENVKNYIVVYGRLLDNGHQVSAISADYKKDSPFSINKIGQINYIVSDENIYSDDLAQQRAVYELFLHARMNDSITLEIVPCFWLNDVNVKISYTNTAKGIDGGYLIKTISIPLSIGSNMSISAIKTYPEDYDIPTYTRESMATGEWYTSEQNQIPYYKKEEVQEETVGDNILNSTLNSPLNN